MKFRYMLSTDGDLLIRDGKYSETRATIQRYDVKLKKWVKDYEMCRVYFGSIWAYIISEDESMKWIKSH